MSRKDARKSILLRLPPDVVDVLRNDPGRRPRGSLADCARRRISRQLDAEPLRHWPDQPTAGQPIPLQLPKADLLRIREISETEKRALGDVIYALLIANLRTAEPPVNLS